MYKKEKKPVSKTDYIRNDWRIKQMKSWKDLFCTHILERGLNYYEEGYVTSLEQNLTGYTAVVVGTENYDVEIEILDNRVYDMTCTCPYAAEGNYCKHMAAVLYEIEEGEPDTKIPGNYLQKVQDQKKELQEIIAGIPIDELQEIVFSQAASDDFLYNRIMTKYAPITPQYMIRLKQQVNDIGYHYSDRGGFVDYYHATNYTEALNNLLDENVPLLLEKNHRMEAFELVNCVFYEIGNRDIDDSDGGTSLVADNCYEYWQTILQECNDEEKETMFQWFQDHQENYVIDYLEDYISDFLLNEFHDEEMLRKKLHMLDEKIAKFQKENYSGDSYSAYYGMVNNITARIYLMEELNYSKKEIREYRQKYRNFSEIRKMEIQEYLSGRKYEEVIVVLKESKILDADKAGLVAEYSQQLIQIYEKRNMQKEYAQELQYQVFECMQRNLEYIVKWKKLYSETEWEEQRERFLQNKTSSWIRYEFLVEEELFERLLQEIRKNNSVSALDQYEKVLKKHLPNEVRDTYVQYVKNGAVRTSDRKAYKYLMSYLKKITKYPDGKKIARDIADCWKQDYKRRPAMMDELRKAGF